FEMIGPRFDRVSPKTDRIEAEARDPAIVVVEGHGRLAPPAALIAILYDRAQLVVTVTKQVGPDLERVADNAFDRIAATVELGVDLLDVNSRFGPPQRVMRNRMFGGGGSRAQHPHPERLDRQPRGENCAVAEWQVDHAGPGIM